jgi:hypothetical protein
MDKQVMIVLHPIAVIIIPSDVNITSIHPMYPDSISHLIRPRLANQCHTNTIEPTSDNEHLNKESFFATKLKIMY